MVPTPPRPFTARPTAHGVGPWAIDSVAFGVLRGFLPVLGGRLAGPARPVPRATVGRVAVVFLRGVLMKASTRFSDGTVAVRRAVRQAAADPEVSAILLYVDSPGGTVSGTADLTADVAEAGKKKPTWAFVEDLCASAAYWVASQCGRVFANNPTALVGSIGTLGVVYDLSGSAEFAGVKTHVFGTGPLKGAGGVPGAAVSDEQRAYFQGLVESGQESFDRAVMSGRRLSPDMLAAVKTGGVFGATEAHARGLIDGIQSFDRTVTMLQQAAAHR